MILLPRQLYDDFLQLASVAIDHKGDNVELLAYLLGTKSENVDIVTLTLLPTQSATSYHVEDNG